MIEDKLSRNERIRLEAIARTQGMNAIFPENWEDFKQQVLEVEKFLHEADKDWAHDNN